MFCPAWIVMQQWVNDDLYLLGQINLKGTVYPKTNSVIIYVDYVIPNLLDILSSAVHKRRYFEDPK